MKCVACRKMVATTYAPITDGVLPDDFRRCSRCVVRFVQESREQCPSAWVHDSGVTVSDQEGLREWRRERA
jgi:hypothetical protein